MEEVSRRRLALLRSHLSPVATPFHRKTPEPGGFSRVSPSNCAFSSGSDADKGNPEIDCVFCKIIRGEAPAVKVYEDDVCLCILDTNPLSHGHSLIIPKCHFSSLEETPPAVVGAMCSMVPLISNGIMKATGCDSFNLLVNNGVAAGQVIFHTHIHIIPRKVRDCLWASESLRRRPLKLDQEAVNLAVRIQEQLSSLLKKSSGDCIKDSSETKEIVGP